MSKKNLSSYLSFHPGTSEEQTQGPLSDAIQEAETQIRTYKTNERNRALLTTLRNAIETQDIKIMELTLTRIKSECRCFLHHFFFISMKINHQQVRRRINIKDFYLKL